MGLENYSNRFSKFSNSDLLVAYLRISEGLDQDNMLERSDIHKMMQLIVDYQKENTLRGNLTLMLQLQGGSFQAALGFVEYLRKIYPNSPIRSVVCNIAKSAGAYLSLVCCDPYMHEDATISDFSVNQNIANNSKETMSLSLKGLLQFLRNLNGQNPEEKIQKYNGLISSPQHAQNILFKEAHDKFGIKPLSSFGDGLWHLESAHNELLIHFDNQPGIAKIFGFNGNYVYS